MEHVTYIDLPHKLTEDELDERRDQLASIAVEIDSEEKEAARLRGLAGEAGKRVKSLRGRSSAVAVEIRNRAATRRTKCVKHYDEEALETIIVRTDTEEVVKIRAMEPHEQQIVLGDRRQGLSRAIRKAITDYRERRARIKAVPDDPELEEEDTEPTAPEQPELEEAGDTTEEPEPEETEPEDPPTEPEPVGDAGNEPEPEAEAAPEEAPADPGDDDDPGVSETGHEIHAAPEWHAESECSMSKCTEGVLYGVSYPRKADAPGETDRARRYYCQTHAENYCKRHDLEIPDPPEWAEDLETDGADDPELPEEPELKNQAGETISGDEEVPGPAPTDDDELPEDEEPEETEAESEDLETDDEGEAGGLIIFDDDEDLETPGGEIPEDEDLAGIPSDEELDELAEQMRPTGPRAVPDPEAS